MTNYSNYTNQRAGYKYSPTSTVAVTPTLSTCSNTPTNTGSVVTNSPSTCDVANEPITVSSHVPTAYDTEVQTITTMYTAAPPQTNIVITSTLTCTESVSSCEPTATCATPIATSNVPTSKSSKTYSPTSLYSNSRSASTPNVTPTPVFTSTMDLSITTTPNPSDAQAFIEYQATHYNLSTFISNLKQEGYTLTFDLGSSKVEYQSSSAFGSLGKFGSFLDDIKSSLEDLLEGYESLPVKYVDKCLRIDAVISGKECVIDFGQISQSGNPYDTWSPSAAVKGLGFKARITF